MIKMSLLFPIVLVISLAISLSEAAASSQDDSPTTAFISYTIQFVSSECELSPDGTWPVDEELYFIITETGCGGPPGLCEDSCNTISLAADDIYMPLMLEAENGMTITTTLIDSHLSCHDKPLVQWSEILIPASYTVTVGHGSYLYPLNIVTDTVILEPIPTPIPPGQIEGRVWQDLDTDGIRDYNEPSLAGINVALMSYCQSENGYRTQVGSTASDSQGIFRFSSVNPELPLLGHAYTLRFDPNHIYTSPNRGSNDATDSDAMNSCPYEEIFEGQPECIIGITHGFQIPNTGIVSGIDAGIIIMEEDLPERNFLPLIRSDGARVDLTDRAVYSHRNTQYGVDNLSDFNPTGYPVWFK